MNRRSADTRFAGAWRNRCHLLSLALLAGALVVSISGCSKQQAAGASPGGNPAEASPILLIGVDGFEWDVVLPLLAEQRLPTLARIMESGSCGLLESFIPTKSPVIWTSVATGKHYTKHGILHFIHSDPSGKAVLYNNGDRRVKAAWNILSDYNRRVCTIGWWMTYPVEPINGVMVAQANTNAQIDTRWGQAIWKGSLIQGMPGQVHPPQRQPEMIAVLADVEQSLPDLTRRIFGDFRHPLSELGQRLWDNCRWAFRADATYARIAVSLLQERPPFDLATVYFGGPDVVGHNFWRYAHPDVFDHKPSPERIENFGSIIDDYYTYIDGNIGELIAASPPDLTVLIISDHGMKPINCDRQFDPDDPPLDVSSAHHKDAPAGFLAAAGPYIRQSQGRPLRELQFADLPRIGSVYDITPTILAILRIPIGEDMDGQVLTHIISEEVDLSDPPRTIATHDTQEFRANRPEVPTIEAHEQERLRQLRDLGYLGGDYEDEYDD